MNLKPPSTRASKLTLIAAIAVASATIAEAQQYKQTNLVSDLPGAQHQDTNLVNPWGLTRSSTSPWWVSDNGSGLSTLYDGLGNAVSLVVTIPPAAGGTMGVPTGTVFNGTTDFKLPNGNPARFLFVGEDGTISGWNGGTLAVLGPTDTGAVYKGAAIATRDGVHYLYVANFKGGRVDVFDTTFQRVRFGNSADESSEESTRAFRDPQLPRGFAPFNVQNIGGDLYVAFARADPEGHDEVAGAGLGYLDVFSPGGVLLKRFEHGAWLNAPWGMALAPSDFGAFSHQLLVGQFGSGEIAVYDVTSGAFIGKMQDDKGAVLAIDGLWALAFGNGATAGPLNTLFFTAGIQDESHGLFGTLTAVSPAPLGSGQ